MGKKEDYVAETKQFTKHKLQELYSKLKTHYYERKVEWKSELRASEAKVEMLEVTADKLKNEVNALQESKESWRQRCSHREGKLTALQWIIITSQHFFMNYNTAYYDRFC